MLFNKVGQIQERGALKLYACINFLERDCMAN